MAPPVVYGGSIARKYMDEEKFKWTFRMECRQRVTTLELLNSLRTLIQNRDILEIGRADGNAWTVMLGSQTAADILNNASILTIGEKTVKVMNVSKQTINIRVHWLPGYIKDTLLEDAFARYGTVTNVTRECAILSATATKKNGIRIVTLETDALTKASIPHLVRYEGGITMLITVPGRPPLCLKCNDVGHVRKDCPTNQAREPLAQHQKPKSYATAVRAESTPTNTSVPSTQETVTTQEDHVRDETTQESTLEDGELEAEGSEMVSQTPKRPLDEDDDLIPCGQGRLVIDEDNMEEEEDSTYELVTRSKKAR